MSNKNLFSDPVSIASAIKNILGDISEYITLVDKDGIMRFASRADFGLTVEDLVGTHYTKIVLPEHQEEAITNFNNALNGKTGIHMAEVGFPDGSIQWFESTWKPLYSENNTIEGVAILSKNITKTKVLALAIKESEERFKKLVESASDIIYSCDAYGHLTYINPVAAELMGFKNDDYIGVHFSEVIRPDYREAVTTFYKQQFDNRTVNTYNEFPVVTKLGDELWLGQNVQIKTDGDYVTGFQALARDITERKHFEKMLIEARTKAIESSKAKEQFLSVMSHEIRTPLNAVIGLTNLLLEEQPTKKQLEHLRAIKFSADSLLHIINDILDFSKIESGKITLEKEDFRLDHLIDSIHNALQSEAAGKGIRFDTKLHDELPDSVNGDSVRLNQILLNLVSNSIKFTQKGGILLEVLPLEKTDEEWKIQFILTDTGIGIPKEKLEAIFDSFTQASKETTRKYGGTGLGLTITKQLIELHGGQIEVESEIGKGSTFKFALRFGRTRDSLELPNKDSEVVYFKKFNSIKCLVVEDNKMNQLVAGKYLEKWGIEFDIAENGVEAIVKVQDNDYDFILMDLEMPDLDGYQTTKHIREDLASPKSKLPIVAVTASAFNNVRNKVLSSGMNDYISKPFEPAILYSKIAKITNQNFDEATAMEKHITNKKSSLIDLTYLKEASGGDTQFIHKMIETFVKHSPDYIEKFQDALDKDNLSELKRIAHKYKATISIVGIKVIEQLIERLESNISSNKNLEEIPEILEKITENTKLATEELNSEVSRL